MGVTVNSQPPALNSRHSTPGSRLVGTAAALGAVIIWGLTFVPSKVALSEMGPFTLAVLRFGVALVILLPLVTPWRLRPLDLARLPWRTLMALGLTGVAIYFGFQNLGLARTSATEAGLISGSVPAVTAALSAIMLRERLRVSRIAGIGGSMAGVAVMLVGSSPNGGGSLSGDLLMLVSAAAWAVYTLLNKKTTGTVPDGLMLVSTIAFGALFLAPAALFEVATAGFGPVSSTGWLSVIFLGAGGSAAAFFCWNAALSRLDASEASTYINLVPLVSVISAALVLGERPTLSQLLGGALVIAGVYMAGRG